MPPDRPTEPLAPVVPPPGPAVRERVVETTPVETVLAPDPLLLEDLRALRRWLAVVGTLAVIATVVAAYALLRAHDANRNSASRARVAALNGRIDRTEARLARDESGIRQLEQRIRGKSNRADVRALDRRIAKLQSSVSSANTRSRSNDTATQALSRRIDTLSRALGRVQQSQP